MKRFLVLGLFAVAACSQAITFDWETNAIGVFGSTSQTVSGLTATATGNPGSIEVFSLSPPFNRCIVGGPFVSGSWHPVRVTFSDLINSLTLDTWDGGANDDDGDLILEAYDQFDNLIDSDTVVYGTATGIQSMSVAGDDISYITFRTTGSSAPHSMALDNLTVNPQSVPEPFTMALMGGAALAGFRRMRRNRA